MVLKRMVAAFLMEQIGNLLVARAPGEVEDPGVSVGKPYNDIFYGHSTVYRNSYDDRH